MFVFFKQKTAYEMRISDWSSDVCSSDLSHPIPPAKYRDRVPPIRPVPRASRQQCAEGARRPLRPCLCPPRSRSPTAGRAASALPPDQADRKSVVSGKSVAVRVDTGGRRLLNKKKN